MLESSPPGEIQFPYEFDSEKRRLSKIYLKQKMLTSVLNGLIIPTLFLLLLLFTGFNILLRNFAISLAPFAILAIPIFILIFQFLLIAIEFPLGFYSSYIFEHKFKLSNYTLRGWFVDYSKELFLGLLIGIPLLSIAFYLLSNFTYWWILVGVLMLVVSIFMAYIFPIIIFPFFYKTEPYSNQEQVNRLLSMVEHAGVKNVNHVVLARESEKSKKPNAMFAGLGKSKTIVLFDTLTNSFTPDEVETVVAHELGHYVSKDHIRFLVIEALIMFPTLFIIDRLLHSSIGLFGISSIQDLALFPLLFLFMEFIEFFINPWINAYSRHRELHADLFALNISRKPLAQISCEKRLADLSLLDHQPPIWLEWLFFTHPNSQKRIDLCYAWAKENKIPLT